MRKARLSTKGTLNGNFSHTVNNTTTETTNRYKLKSGVIELTENVNLGRTLKVNYLEKSKLDKEIISEDLSIENIIDFMTDNNWSGKIDSVNNLVVSRASAITTENGTVDKWEDFEIETPFS
jgi:hypothetical protein